MGSCSLAAWHPAHLEKGSRLGAAASSLMHTPSWLRRTQQVPRAGQGGQRGLQGASVAGPALSEAPAHVRGFLSQAQSRPSSRSDKLITFSLGPLWPLVPAFRVQRAPGYTTYKDFLFELVSKFRSLSPRNPPEDSPLGHLSTFMHFSSLMKCAETNHN
ncbi:hypothetical protein MC885_009783, partial [Smutsia gigantea]